jgi:hypothetical protein
MINIVKDNIFVINRPAGGDRILVSAIIEEKIYSAEIDVSMKPPSRPQNDTDWLSMVENALSNSCTAFELKTEISANGSNLSIKVLEAAVGKSVKLLLVKFDMTEEQLNKSVKLRDLFRSVQGEVAQRGQRAETEVFENKVLADKVDSLERELQEMRESKETLINDLMQKMCVLLNSKKREIDSLRQQVKLYESSGLRPSVNTDAEDEKCKRAKRSRTTPVSKEAAGITRRQLSDVSVTSNDAAVKSQQSQAMTQMLAPVGEEIGGDEISSFLQQSRTECGKVKSASSVEKVDDATKSVIVKKSKSKKRLNIYPSSSDDDETESPRNSVDMDKSFDILDFTA